MVVWRYVLGRQTSHALPRVGGTGHSTIPICNSIPVWISADTWREPPPGMPRCKKCVKMEHRYAD